MLPVIYYSESIPFRLEMNIRKFGGTIKKSETKADDYIPDPDDMENLRKPDWWDDWKPTSEVINSEEAILNREPLERNWLEEDYYQDLRDSQEYERGYDPVEDMYELWSRSAYHS